MTDKSNSSMTPRQFLLFIAIAVIAGIILWQLEPTMKPTDKTKIGITPPSTISEPLKEPPTEPTKVEEEKPTKPTSTNGNGNIEPKPKRLQAVYLESAEKNFTQSSTIFSNRLKSALSTEGYSFTESLAQASFRLKITATTRHHGTEYGLTICYADVAVALFDVRTNRSIFQDEFSQKGISSTREAAGRKALEDAAPIIANKIPAWSELIKN